MITIKEIADLAGVSRGTVDRVLNNRGSVNDQTSRRIREIVKALDYHPNKAGLALAAQKKKITIGVLFFGEGNLFFDDVMEGVSYQANKLAGYGCTVITKRCPFDAQAQLKAMEDLTAEGIHGLVLSPYNSPEIIAKINELSESGIPVITANTDVADSRRIAYVGSNYYEGGCTAGGLMGLITGGSAKLGIITGSPMVLCHTERIAGFLDTIHKYYPGIRLLDTVANQDDEFKSFQATDQLLTRYPDLSALYFTAAGVYGGCRAVIEHGREKSIRIISYDSVNTTKQMVSNGVIAATICQQPFQQGSRPVKLLFDCLTTGICPDSELQYTEAAIKIRENINLI